VGLPDATKDKELSQLIVFVLEVTKEAISIQVSNVNAATDGGAEGFDIFLAGKEPETNDEALELNLEAATNDESIYNKISYALQNNYGEIVAYIMQELKLYFADSSHGYDDVDEDNLTVEITISGIGDEDSAATTPATLQNASDFIMSYWLYLAVATVVGLILCCGLVLLCMCCCWNSKDPKAANMKREMHARAPPKQAIEMAKSRSQSQNTCEIAEASPASLISASSMKHSQAIKRVESTGDADDTDSEDLQEIQQTIEEKQKQWIDHQLKRQQQSPSPNERQNMYPSQNNMQIQAAQSRQQQYLQQQQYINNMMMQQQYMNNMMQQQAPQRPVFAGELPEAPSEVAIPAQYTARLSLDPNGVDQLLHVDDKAEFDAYAEGADIADLSGYAAERQQATGHM